MKIRTDQLRSLIQRQVQSLSNDKRQTIWTRQDNKGSVLLKDVDTGRRTTVEILKSADEVRIQFGSIFSITITVANALDLAHTIKSVASG